MREISFSSRSFKLPRKNMSATLPSQTRTCSFLFYNLHPFANTIYPFSLRSLKTKSPSTVKQRMAYNGLFSARCCITFRRINLNTLKLVPLLKLFYIVVAGVITPQLQMTHPVAKRGKASRLARNPDMQTTSLRAR